MRYGKSTWLSQPQWRNGPWSSEPESKTPFDHLVDILLDVSDLSSLIDTLKVETDPHQILLLASETICKCHEAESSLEQWYRDFKTKVPGALYHVELSKIHSAVDDLDSGKLFPVSFQFPAFIVGQCLIFYWVALMCAQANLCFAYFFLRRMDGALQSMGKKNMPCTCDVEIDDPMRCLQHFVVGMLPSIEDRVGWPRLSHKICQSVEYFLQETMGAFGPTSLLPALATAKGFLKHADGRWDREIAWVDEMINHIRKNGNGIACALDEESDSKPQLWFSPSATNRISRGHLS
jgi:hypothetical protein